MKSTTIIILLLVLFSCNNQTNKKVVQEKTKTISVDSAYIDSTEIGGDYKEWNNTNTFALKKKIYLNAMKVPMKDVKIIRNAFFNAA